MERYVEKAIDSVINQTICFEDNIQLILVNDGSTDGTEDILLYYKSLYPDNIFVLNQENQGQAAARNNGLKYVVGEYVNFLDSDDYLSENAMKEVYDFFSLNGTEIDVVSLPLCQFGRTNDNHILNYKFDESRIIDLIKEPNNPQLHVSSSFIRFDSIKDTVFLTNIIASEDANFVNKILLQKQKLGVLNTAYYFYRKHQDFSSTLDNASKNIGYYTNRLNYHFLGLIDYSIKLHNFVPKFIQYTLIYDLFWLVNETKSEIFESLDKKEFMDAIHKILNHVDEEVIWDNNNLKYDLLRKFLFYLKFNDYHIIPDSGVKFMVSDKQIDKLSYHSFWIDNIKLINNFVYISGFLNSHFNNNFISISAIKEMDDGNVKKYLADYVGDNGKNITYLSQIWQFSYNFEFKIPLIDFENSSIRICVNYHMDHNSDNFEDKNISSHFINIGFNDSSNISKECNYFVKDNFLLAFDNKQFYIMSNSFKGIINIK